MSRRRFKISDVTRDRCEIFQTHEFRREDFQAINFELYHYFYQVDKITFNLYIQVEAELVTYMRPAEASKELLDQLAKAYDKYSQDIEILIAIKEYDLFTNFLKQIRRQKINDLLQQDPHLDRKTLELFGDLSNASQMVVRGGLGGQTINTVSHAAAKLVDNMMSNHVAVGTLSRMVHCDPTLYDHSASVAMIATVISTQLMKQKFSKQESELIAKCGLYHDVGKTCVPNDILNKPGKFTDAEYEVMKTHTTLGHEELIRVIEDGAAIEQLCARVALEHHERFAGHGYPQKRKGRAEDDPENGIHIATRIVTIADVYSALLMKRVYKPAYESGQAIKIMADGYQDDYDPDIFIPFLKHVVDSLNYYTKMDQKSSGRLLIIEDGKLKQSS